MADEHDLHRLAPGVDREAAVAAFRRRRRRSRSLRRGAWATAAMTVVVAGSVALVSTVYDDDAPVRTGPSGESVSDEPVAFEVIAVTEASDEMGTLRSAVDEGEYANLWKYANTGDPKPLVDFGEQVVVSITIPDNSCPPELTSFTLAGDVITPVFVEPPGGCDDPLIPKTFVVVLGRAALEPEFTLHLPADEIYGFDDQRLDVELGEPGAGSGSTCDDIERFAERVTNTGIQYDFQPTKSPEALLESADLVLYGTLTGGFETRDVDVEDDPSQWSFVGYEIDVDTMFKGTEEARLADEMLVWLEYGRATVESQSFQEVAVAGTPVVVFAYVSEAAPGYVAAIEGFATGCPGEPPIGRIGGAPDWQSLTTLDDLVARLEVATSGDEEVVGSVSGTFIAVGGPLGAADDPLSGTITAISSDGETTTAVATDGVFGSRACGAEFSKSILRTTSCGGGGRS